MIELNHKCSEHEANTGFEALPVGNYPAMVVKVERKNTKANDGAYLNLEIQICKGEYQNRLVFSMLHLWNKSEKAVSIARGTLTAIGDAIGVSEFNDADQMLNKVLTVKLGIREYNGEKQNEVKGFEKYSAFDEPQAQVPSDPKSPVGDEAPF